MIEMIISLCDKQSEQITNQSKHIESQTKLIEKQNASIESLTENIKVLHGNIGNIDIEKGAKVLYPFFEIIVTFYK